MCEIDIHTLNSQVLIIQGAHHCKVWIVVSVCTHMSKKAYTMTRTHDRWVARQQAYHYAKAYSLWSKLKNAFKVLEENFIPQNLFSYYLIKPEKKLNLFLMFDYKISLIMKCQD